MRWRVLIIFAVSLFLVAEGRKRRAGARSLDKKSSASTPKTAVEPADKQGSRYVYLQSTPYRTPYEGSTGVRRGIQSATVDASVIEESMGEGGFFIGPNASKSKSNEVRSTVDQEQKPHAETETAGGGFPRTGAVSHYPQPQPTGLPNFGQGMFLPQIGTGPSVSQGAGSFMPKYFQNNYRHHTLPGSDIFQGGAYPGQGFFRIPSFMNQFPLRTFMGQNSGSFMSPGFDIFGNSGVNNGYRPDGTYTPPTSDPGAGMYGPGVGFQNRAGNWQANNGMGTYGSGAGTYRTGTGMYGAQPGERMYGNPTRIPYYGSARELYLKRRKHESSNPRIPRPKINNPNSSASSGESKIPNMLLAQLLSIKGEPKLYKNIRDITWSTVEVNATGFTVIAEFTSVLPTRSFQCTAIVTGSKVSEVMRLNGNESDLDCIPPILQPPRDPHQAAPSGNLELRNLDASRGLIPVNLAGYEDIMREQENIGMYANKDNQAINPESNGYAYYQYIDNPYGL